MPSTNHTMPRFNVSSHTESGSPTQPTSLKRLCCRSSAMIALAMLAMTSVAAAQDPLEQGYAASDLSAEPYSIFVVQAGSHTRCGPGKDFYRTDDLRRGQQLDVYLETADGWLGVRPPENSFSWIPADDVELDNRGETGTVTQDRSVVWIGTNLGRARKYRWQIQLPAGEPVTILGSSEREGPDGPKKWYRIVPPSGEFRWVHRSEVAESAEELIASVTRADAQNQPTPAASENESTTRRDGKTDSNGQSILDRFASQIQSRISPAKTPSYAESPDLVPRTKNRNSQNLSPVTQSPSLRSIADTGALNTSVSPVDGFQAAGQSVMPQSQQTVESTVRNSAVGSGLRTTTPTNPTNANATIATAAYGESSAVILGQPRMVSSNAAPRSGETAQDSNWVTVDRNNAVNPQANNIGQVGHLQPIKTHDLAAALHGVSTTMDNVADQHANRGTTGRSVDPKRVEAVRDEARTANLARLQLIFSRLIAASASEAEIEPIERAAQDLAAKASDDLIRSRAGVLIERAQQYRRIARRRDGQSIFSSSNTPRVPQRITNESQNLGSVIQTASATIGGSPIGGQPLPTSPAADNWVAGKLVQVYSARDRHPPYALTDNSGRTIAYVTPNPGLNLRTHLNSEVRVTGRHGFLSGMKTPHVLVTKAIRVSDGR